MSRLDTDSVVDNSGDEFTTFCASHPKVETRLRCGKCDRPICPKCLVFTPVGARCRACANMRPLPMFQIGPLHYARAIGTALAVGLVGGMMWAFLGAAIPFIAFWLVLLVGYVSGEAISLATNRKRGRGLQVIAGLTVVLAYLVSSGLFLFGFSLLPLARLFGSPMLLLIFALGVYIAVKRV